MSRLKFLPSEPVIRSYICYSALFLLLWLIFTIVDLAFGPFDNFSLSFLLHSGDLASAMYVGLELAAIATGLFAAACLFRKKRWTAIWITLGVVNALIMASVYAGVTPWADRATHYAFTNIYTENLSIALNEQILYGEGSIWATLLQRTIITELLPLSISFCFGQYIYKREHRTHA